MIQHDGELFSHCGIHARNDRLGVGVPGCRACASALPLLCVETTRVDGATVTAARAVASALMRGEVAFMPSKRAAPGKVSSPFARRATRSQYAEALRDKSGGRT